jgi:hypothetical protein
MSVLTKILCVAALGLQTTLGFSKPILIGFVGGKESGFRFLLKERDESEPQWRHIGQSIEGYLLSDFDIANEVLTLTKEKDVIKLKVERGTIGEAKVDPIEKKVAQSAAQVIEKFEKWISGVNYKITPEGGGVWSVIASKEVEGVTESRRIRITSEGRVLNYSVLASSKQK